MEGEVNILREGLKLAQSKFDISYMTMKETFTSKFDSLDVHVNE